jgi:hypothetical protein
MVRKSTSRLKPRGTTHNIKHIRDELGGGRELAMKPLAAKVWSLLGGA